MTDEAQERVRRVLVIGAYGALGSLTAEAFRRAGWSVLAGTRRRSTAADVRHVDLDEPATVDAALTDVDAVINTVPDGALRAERAVLRRGGVLVNLSALPAAAGRGLRSEVAHPRGTVLMNAGLAPGLTNLVAADLLAAHPEADEVEMVFTISVAGTAGPAAADFAHRGLTAMHRHRTVRVPLPAPFGDRRCLGFAEPDGGWLETGPHGPAVSTYVCFAGPAVHRLMLGLNIARAISHLPRALLRAGSTKPGTPPSREPVAHWIAVRRDGRRIAARTVEGHGDFLLAAATTPMFTDALLGRRHRGPAAPGLWNPEELLPLPALSSALAEAGVRVTEQQLQPVKSTAA
ncbi:MAG: NAD-dependent epimerase/dehydratase family protein [Pseudonocardia sp.]|nr:NAD-dependent epimerase/dehydratase family protein [Pseudonocardia sp.]